MARLNVSASGPAVLTHEGAPAVRITPLLELRRSVLTALLWEDTFYEKGSDVSKRIQALVSVVKPADVAAVAIEARERMYLRHVPLFLVRELARTKGNGSLVADTLARVIQRPDELTEYLAMYWQGQTDADKAPLSAGSKRGLARAFRKFKAETLAKYDRDNVVKLRDVLRLTHAKPNDTEQASTWKQVIKRELAAPDTWEVALSSGANKKDTFERLLREQKLGGLAFLRNLRNMIEASVDTALIRERFAGRFDRVLPFRFLSAVRHAPAFASELDTAMLRVVADIPKLSGRTLVLVDVSPSMHATLSAKSELTRTDAACGLAVLIREIAENGRVFAFSSETREAPAFHGLALVNGIQRAVPSNGTLLGAAIRRMNELPHDRLIVLTDEESQDQVTAPTAAHAYMINLSTSKNGVGYGNGWTAHIDGWSERVLDFIREVEVQP